MGGCLSCCRGSHKYEHVSADQAAQGKAPTEPQKVAEDNVGGGDDSERGGSNSGDEDPNATPLRRVRRGLSASRGAGFEKLPESEGNEGGMGVPVTPPSHHRTGAFSSPYANSPLSPIGARVGPESFTKIKLLGRGDVGRVYLVSKKDTDELYAMKVLRKADMIERKKIKRVLTEREILATARHPFIVTLYYSFQTEDKLYFIMEYCAGGEFFRMLQRLPNKRLTEDQARFYIAEVLLALEYLHVIGFIYRDLKPENILLHASGHIRLADFDLSKQVDMTGMPSIIKASPLNALSRGGGSRSSIHIDTRTCASGFTNSFVGTEEYIAPEVITGKGHSSCVDFWTVGILLYEMLYGSTPFKGADRNETFDRIVKGGLTLPKEPAISRQGRDLIKRLLAPQQERRLGFQHGASDVMRHAFFKSISFPMLHNTTPPIVPTLVHRLDTGNFRSFGENLTDDTESVVDDDELTEDDPFRDFKTVSRPRGSIYQSP
eukprot:Opistho-1_new@65381